jgi:hypothetical protein
VIIDTGPPDGRIGMASRPQATGVLETETADDFIVNATAIVVAGSFTGLIPAGVPLSAITRVTVEVYRVFPKDSNASTTGCAPTRTNSPSDVQFDSRDSAASNLSFTAAVVNSSFSVANTVDNGINCVPNQMTGGEGAASGQEVQFNFTLTSPFTLPGDHYFFVPQVGLSSGHFLWLSAAGPPQFPGDLQTWIRNTNLDPDWLRVGTDIVGGSTAPKFNGSFSLTGTPPAAVPDIGSGALMALSGFGALAVGIVLRRRPLQRRTPPGGH